MASRFDFAILGSSAFAALLAASLAIHHRQRVCLVVDAASPLRLPLSFDFALPFATRPETWAVFARSLGHTRELLRKSGSKAWREGDVTIRTTTVAGANFLGHLRQIASFHGVLAEPGRPLPRETVSQHLFRSIVRLTPLLLAQQMQGWLERKKLVSVTSETTDAFRTADALADRIVLADDDVILRWIPIGGLPRPLLARPMISTLFEPARLLSVPAFAGLETDTRVFQVLDGSIRCLAPAGIPVRSEISTLLGRNGATLQRAGERSFLQPISTDGVPVFFELKDPRTTALSGLGHSAPFFAPAIARWLVGRSDPGEQAFFSTCFSRDAEQRAALSDGFMDDLPMQAA